MKRLAVLALVAGIAAADPVLVQDDELTVYETGDQVFVFADKRMGQMVNLAGERNSTVAKLVPVWDGEMKKAGVDFYVRRIRPFGDALKCEKFARRPVSKDLYPEVLKWLAEQPCGPK